MLYRTVYAKNDQEAIKQAYIVTRQIPNEYSTIRIKSTYLYNHDLRLITHY